VFEVLTAPCLESHWVCEETPNSATEKALIAEVQDWVNKKIGVIIIGPCARDVKELGVKRYCLFPVDQMPWPVLSNMLCYLREAGPVTLDRQIDQQPQKRGLDHKTVEGPA
jgi:hypothetical protein